MVAFIRNVLLQLIVTHSYDDVRLFSWQMRAM